MKIGRRVRDPVVDVGLEQAGHRAKCVRVATVLQTPLRSDWLTDGRFLCQRVIQDGTFVW